MFFKRMKHFGRIANRRRQRGASHHALNLRNATGLQIEGLENRSLLVGDLSAIAGDSNLDGHFNSSDLVQVFQNGKFETGEAASWADGDWNGDAQFTTSDLVASFQLGSYGDAELTMLAAIDATNDDATTGDGTEGTTTDPTTDPTTDDTDETTDTPTDDAKDPTSEMGEHGGHQLNHLRGGGVQRIINHLKDALANQGDLPGNLTAEEAQKLVDNLTTALAAGDKDAIGELLKTLQQEKLEDRIQHSIDNLKERLTKGNLPGNLTTEQVQKTIDDLTAALSTGNLETAQTILKDLRQSILQDHKQDHLQDRLQEQIDRLKEGIASNDLPGDLSAADAQRLLDALIAAQASGDLTGVHQLQFTMRVEKLITKLNTAIADGSVIPLGLTKEAAETLVKGLQDALAAGNLDAAQVLLQNLHPSPGNHDGDGPDPTDGNHPPRGGHGGRGHHPVAPHEDEDTEDTTPDPADETPTPAPAPPAGIVQAIKQRAARRRGR